MTYQCASSRHLQASKIPTTSTANYVSELLNTGGNAIFKMINVYLAVTKKRPDGHPLPQHTPDERLAQAKAEQRTCLLVVDG